MVHRFEIPHSTHLKERIKIISHMVTGLWAGLVVSAAVIMFLKQDLYHLRWIFFPLSILVCLIPYYLHKTPGSIKNILEKSPKDSSTISTTISVIYLNFLSYRYTRTIILLVLLSVVFSLLSIMYFDSKALLSVNSTVVFVATLLVIRMRLVDKRITYGLFGTNADEAKEIIKFILAHSKDIDLSGGDGKPRKCFLPEKVLSFDLVPPAGEVQT